MPKTNPNLGFIKKKRLERQSKYGNVLFDVFANKKELINLENTKKKTEENVRKLKHLQEYYKAKDAFDEKEYEKVNIKLEKRLRS